jgi:predicted RNase H-like nuclease
MTILAGVDGCKFGWICITKDLENGALNSRIFRSSAELFAQTPTPAVFSIDIPIGLTDSGPRQCDIQARRLLGARRGTSVFSAPIRPVLNLASREEADKIHRSIDGNGVNVFSWNLYPRIRDVDSELQKNTILREKVYEVHPEISFRAINDGVTIITAKRNPRGESIRRALVENRFGLGAFDEIRKNLYRKDVANHDINDAFAVLWTAKRIYRKEGEVIPADIEFDSAGLRMGIWY